MGETVKIVLFSAIALVVGLIVGAIICILYRKKVAEAEIGSAEAQAKKIIADYEPAFKTYQEYFDFVDSLDMEKQTVVYEEDGTVTLDFTK